MEGNKKFYRAKRFLDSNFLRTIPLYGYLNTQFLFCAWKSFSCFLVLSCGVVLSFHPSVEYELSRRTSSAVCINEKAVVNIAKVEKQFQLIVQVSI